MSLRDKMKQKAMEGPKPLPYPTSRCCGDGFSEAWVMIRKENKVGPVDRIIRDRRTGRASKSRIQPKPIVGYTRAAKFFRCWTCQKPTGHRLKLLGEYRKRFPSSLWMRLQSSGNFFLEELRDGGLIEYDWTKHPFHIEQSRRRSQSVEGLADLSGSSQGGSRIHAHQPSFQASEGPGDAQEPGDDPKDVQEKLPSKDGVDFGSQEDAF